jgi:uncharacterized membrane protein YjgN (DUF898 family)
MKAKIHFEGHFGEYFVMSLGLLILSAITFGLAAPYWIYWSVKYFFTRLSVGDAQIAYVGHFGEYFVMSLALLLLSVVTLGLALPYYVYWNFKYFFDRLELHAGVISPVAVPA